MREFDVIVFGATGFTGKLCAEYIFRTYGVDEGKLRWAIAGRSQSKLEKAKRDIGKITGDAEGAEAIATVVADSADIDSLRAMCARTKAVVSTVGPFMLYGTLLVEACVEEGTDYCDSTGETTWIKRMITMYEEKAIANGVRLVPSCGYDSLPTDLTVFKLVEGIKADNPEAEIEKVVNYIGPMRGGISGGTLHTAMNIVGNEDKKLLMDVYSTPFALVPKGETAGKKGGDQRWVQFHKSAGKYTAPFVMAAGNERFVRRSAAFNGYGDSFRFTEVMAFSSFWPALMATLAINIGTFLVLFPPIRWLLIKYVLPAPGEGPSRKTMDKGFGIQTAHTVVDKTHYTVVCHISKGDAGYKSTGMMLAESAIALAKSKDSVKRGGFLTPASCPGMQNELIEALEEKCGIFFEFAKHNSGSAARAAIRASDSKL